MKLLGLSLLIAFAALAIYFIYLVHSYPTKKLRRIRAAVQELDALIGVELFGAWSPEEERRVMQLLNDLRELTDDE